MLPHGLIVDENEVINTADTKFFEELGGVLNSTSKRIIANYVMWRIVYAKSNTQTEQLSDLAFQYRKDAEGYEKKMERWKRCVAETDWR